MNSITIESLKRSCDEHNIIWSTHALEQLHSRNILRKDILNSIYTGEIIENYPNDFPYPSCLVFGYKLNGEIIHTVVGYDDNNCIYIVTAYYPTAEKFEIDLKTRKVKDI